MMLNVAEVEAPVLTSEAVTVYEPGGLAGTVTTLIMDPDAVAIVSAM